MQVTMTQAPSRKPIVEDDMTSQPLVLHWRYNSLRGPVHQTFPDVLMSSQSKLVRKLQTRSKLHLVLH